MKNGFKSQSVIAICFSLVLTFSFVSASAPSADFLFRQKTFYKVMELSRAELKNLNENLNGLKTDKDSDYAKKKDEFLKKLSEFEIYDKEVEEEISKTKTVEDLKNLAVDFKNWREEAHNPQVQIMMNFSLILKQKEILATTTERFEKIEKDVKKLTDLGLEQKQQLNSLLDLAKNRLNLANDSFQKAKTILDDYLYATSTLSTSTTSTSTTSTSTTTEKQFNNLEFQELIKESFEKIKEVYEIFLKMSGLARKT